MSSLDTKQTTMANPPKNQTKMVKIKTIKAIRLMRDGHEKIFKPGEVVEVTEAEAQEFCDRTFNLGVRNTFGNYDQQSTPQTIVKRAERVA